ncbi:MAG: hypothetical protein PHN63_05270 [Candidatus Omnitrophica bacterium]|nr:hypothetical protein [Candidatus Omnitrophota bacterium]
MLTLLLSSASPLYASSQEIGLRFTQKIVTARNFTNFAKVRILDSTRTPANEWKIDKQFINSEFPAIADLDGDGKDEMILTTTQSRSSHARAHNETIYAYKEDGSVLFERAMPPSSDPSRAFALREPLIAADLNGDGTKEIICRYESALYVIDKAGRDLSPAWPKPLETAYTTVAGGMDRMAVGNFDDDADLEIAVAQNEAIHIFNIDGSCVNGWPVKMDDSHSIDSIRCGDIDGDGRDEVVMIAIAKDAKEGIKNRTIYCLGRSGAELFVREAGCVTDMIPADLDGDDSCELILGADKGIDVIGRDGNSLKGWPFVSAGQSAIPRLAVDVDGDGEIEIIAERPGNRRLLILGPSGKIKASKALDRVMLPAYETRMHYVDLDNDGSGELVVERRPGGVFSAYKTKAPFNPSLAQWPTPHHDKSNTNRWVSNSPKEETISVELNDTSWAISAVKTSEKRSNLNSAGLPAHSIKNAGNVPVKVGIRYVPAASNVTLLPGQEQGKDRFVTIVNGSIVPERGEAVLPDMIVPGASSTLYLTYGAPTGLSEKASGMSATYEIRAYKAD